jgi:ubiquinone/menaquinone biosynthesis C-methylase UbiE
MAMKKMIEVRATTAQVRRAYDAFSWIYGLLLSPLHRATNKIVLERARIGLHDRVLEVAIGPATSFVEVCGLTGTAAVGVDLSLAMLRAAQSKLKRHAVPTPLLVQADARALPFRTESFDVVLSSHFLDLLSVEDINRVSGEFYRVLKPGGRLALANMSKLDEDKQTLWERAYHRLPASLTAYLLGACRPVFAAEWVREHGFANVKREYCRGAIRSEILSAKKPVLLTRALPLNGPHGQ